jgi:hypothetical protein
LTNVDSIMSPQESQRPLNLAVDSEPDVMLELSGELSPNDGIDGIDGLKSAFKIIASNGYIYGVDIEIKTQDESTATSDGTPPRKRIYMRVTPK